jgi:hypothetical protein
MYNLKSTCFLAAFFFFQITIPTNQTPHTNVKKLELLNTSWGVPGSAEESVRQDLLFHTTITIAAPIINLHEGQGYGQELAPRQHSFHGAVDVQSWNTSDWSSCLTSWYYYFFTPKIRPLTFKILGFRVTRDYVLAAFASLLLAVVNILIRLSIY